MRSFSKKALAVILSVLMAATTMPFTVLANSSTDAEAVALKTSMETYEGLMDGTIYNNMLAAYNAYIDANEAYDAYIYGNGTAAQLTAAKNALDAANTNMTVWTAPSFDAVAYHEGNVANNAYSNVVYSSTTTNWSGSNGYNNNYVSIGSQKVKIAMPTNIVFAYDGTHDIYGPVLFEHTRDGGHNTNTKWVGADDSNWELRDYWYGYYDSNNQNYQMWPGDTKNASNNDSYFGYSAASYQENVTSNITSSRFYWNKLYFKGTPDTTNYYTKTYRQTFHMVGWRDNWGSSGNKEGTIYSDNTQYVINYAPVIAQLNTSSSSTIKGKLAALVDSDGSVPVENYTLGGLGGTNGILTVIDSLISSNPKNYNYGSDVEGTVTTCASDIKSALAAVDSATATADADGYKNLRSAISQSKPVYIEGNDDNYYNATLWTTFSNAYVAATDHMTGLATGSYSTSATAQTLADRLNTAYNNLINSIQNVDTTALETAIDDAEYAIANQAYWTADSFTHADLQNVINTAKIAVWTSVDKYKSIRAKSQTTEETVAAQTSAVQAALVKLVINKDYEVQSAGGYSANSAVAYATDTDNFVPADYANWVDVQSAINAASNYDAAMGNYSDNCASQKIRSYQVVIRNIFTAIRNLKLAFSKMGNGELISAGNDSGVVTAVGSPDSLGAGQDFNVNFWGYDNSIVFRTTHSADYLKLPDSNISLWTQSGFPMGLDAINISDPSQYAPANDGKNGQMTSGGNETNTAVASDVIANNNICAGLTADNDAYVSGTVNKKQGKLVLGRVDNRSDSGIFVNASRVSPISNSIYATMADNTRVTTADDVSDDNYFTTDLTDNLNTFDNIDNHPNDGNVGALGAVWTSNKNTTEMRASTSLYVSKENSNKLTSTTKLSVDTYTFTDKQFGALIWWKYQNVNTFGYTYHGYRHDWTNYSRTIQVVNIADLFRLIQECEDAGYAASEYTNASWTAYASALAAAKDNLEYSNKSAEWVLEQCQTRYDNLFAAREGLVKAADRSALIAARDEVKAVYDAGKNSSDFGGPWSDESWSAFANYYSNNVVAALNDTYSATNVRNYTYYNAAGTDKSDAQKDIEARAARVVDLRKALQSNADFTPLDNAVTALTAKVNSGSYTTASIAEVKAALEDVEYFWYSEAERKAVFASTEADAAIAAAAAAVEAAGNLLVAADADVVANSDDIASAARAELAKSNKDPDAYDYQAVQSMIDSLVATTANAPVFENNSYYGELKTTGYTWQHMSEVNALVTDALSQNFKTYTITITGVADASATEYEYTVGGEAQTAKGATLSGIPYGTEVRIHAPNSQYCNWYYTFTSATTSNANRKYLTNDNIINFVIVGDTTFDLENETNVAQDGKVKLTYASSLRNTSYLVEYVEKGEVTLPEAPKYANYTFMGYTVDGNDYAAGDTLNVTKETTVIANYECEDEDGIVLYIANLKDSITNYSYVYASYNQKVEITKEGLSTPGTRNAGSVTVDGEEKTLGVSSAFKNYTYNGDSIYAYTVIKGDLAALDENEETEFERIIETRDKDAYDEPDAQLLGAETILAYGENYTFFASENMIIIPYTKAEYDEAVAEGFVKNPQDENGASVFASSDFVRGEDKISIVSNYVLPEGCEYVEAGILFTAKKNSEVPSVDLTFNNVGSNGIARMKSSKHTVGNQYVISPFKITGIPAGTVINAKYVAYLTYTDANGNQNTVLSDPQSATVTI